MAKQIKLRPKKTDESYPMVWTGKARPSGYYMYACRITKGRRSEICTVEFKNGQSFFVERKLVKHG